MERMTHRYVGGTAWASIYKVSACGENECKGPIIDRLAAYEDTGLEPEEIMALIAPPNPPLTVDEFREMDGMPVWVCEPNGANGVWGLVDLEYQMIRLHGGGLAIWENNDKSWVAYRRKLEGSQ